jgi:hypothetical protein
MTFSAPINAATAAGNVGLRRGGQAVPATVNVAGNVVNVTPQQKLMPLASYVLAADTGLRGSNAEALATAASVQFVARDGSWQTSTPIETDNAGEAFDPQLAVDSRGNVMAVWYQSDDTRYNIWANRFASGAGWGTPTLLENGAGNATLPRVVADADGNFIAVWSQSDGTHYNIWSSRYVEGAGWGSATLLDTNDTFEALDPRIAIDAAGNALAVWSQGNNAWANRYVRGVGWGTPVPLGQLTNAFGAEGVTVAMEANGNAWAVWSQNHGTDSIWASRYTAGVGWGTAFTLESGSGAAYVPQIAIDASGNALAVWRQSDGTRPNIWASRYTGTAWDAATLIETDDAGTATAPQIAVDASGAALAVWRQSDGTRNNIWANRYLPGSGWGTATLIETDNTGNAFSPQVAMDANGNGLAVWHQRDATRDNIWSNRYVAGVGWGAATLVETDNGSASSAQIVIDSGGEATAIWNQHDGSVYSIHSGRFQ